MAVTIVGGSGQNVGPLISYNVPAGSARQSAAQLGIWTTAASTALSAQFVSTPVALSIHSVIATVYGSVGTGTMAITMQRQILPSPGKINMASFTINANTLAPQMFGPYAKGAQPVQAATASPTVVFFAVATSTTWTQANGGVCFTIHAYH